MSRPLSRRTFIAFGAAALVAPVRAHAASGPEPLRWLGQAMAVKSEIIIETPDRARAEAALTAARVEIARLEEIFGPGKGTALSRLNAAGRLDAPPADLVTVLEAAARLSEMSSGAFDVTVQPLWRLHADSLHRTGRPPVDEAIAAARAAIGWRGVSVSAARIAFDRPGMAVTLDGLARGYVTDRVVELLERQGITHALVDIGGPRVIGPHDIGPRGDGAGWPVSIRDPMMRGVALHRFDLKGGAMATAEALKRSFPGFGRYGHLISPATGKPALGVPSVTVLAPTAIEADGLATAIAVAGWEGAAAMLPNTGEYQAILVSPDSRMTTTAGHVRTP